MKPKEKAMTQPKSGKRAKTLFRAAKATERAMMTSTNRELRWTIFSAARLKVTECARVKAVTILKTEIRVRRKLELTCKAPARQRKTEGKRRARRNRMWSTPVQM